MVNAASILAIANTARSGFNPIPFSPGFDIARVVSVSKTLPAHSWEFGTESEALLEFYNPELSVFGAKPFPVPTVHASIEPLQYAASKITFGTGPDTLANAEGSTTDPSSLGVSAVLLGKTNASYATAVTAEISYITTGAPLYVNGAISARTTPPSLWSDFMYFAPPFLAYAGADEGNLTLIHTAYVQCGLYRDVLKVGNGAWEHIVGPGFMDLGLWASGNAFAVGGLVRVLATVTKAPIAAHASWRGEAIANLTTWIKEIVDASIGFPEDNHLLRNYLNDTTSPFGFGEITGSSMVAATIYRMALLQPKTFGEKYINWADKMRGALSHHVTSAGIATPAGNPTNFTDPVPWTTGAPIGQSFMVSMYAGWRDCVQAGVCQRGWA